jgi:uncharacterized protein (DUF779 family)
MAKKVTATPEALQLLAEIVADHGPVLFHRSSGCCDGSSPMCYPAGDFLIGDNDLRLGEIGGAVLGLPVTPQRRFYATSERTSRGSRSSIFTVA